MGKRVKLPVDQVAATSARAEFYRLYPQLQGPQGQRLDVAATDPNYRAYRKKWLELYEKFGGETYDGKQYQGKYPDSLKEPVAYDNPILAIYILDGNNHTYLVSGANAIQYVNLPAEAKWVDGNHVRNIDRLSRTLRVKVEFTKQRAERFWVQLIAHRDNTEYSAPEKAARPSFQYQRNPRPGATSNYTNAHGAEYRGQTGNNGTHVTGRVFEVTPAVGDRYRFIAWDSSGNKVYSVVFTTKRAVYYMTMTANNAPHAVPHANFCNRIEPVYSAVHTQMIYLGHEVLTNAAGDCYDIDFPDQFLGEVNRVSNNQYANIPNKIYAEFSPFLLRFVFADHLVNSVGGSWFPLLPVGPRPIGPGSAAVDVPVQTRNAPLTDPTADMRKALWIGFGRSRGNGNQATVPGNHWFISGELVREDRTTVNIPAANCTPVEIDPPNRPGFYGQVRVRVDNLAPIATTGTIKLQVIFVNHSVSGVAKKPQTPGAVIQASRSSFRIISEAAQSSAAIHEMGHALGMVANPVDSGVDTPQFRYDYNGNHCHNGIAPVATPGDYHQNPAFLNQAQCVMFGLIPTPPRMNFCNPCSQALKKLDVSAGFS